MWGSMYHAVNHIQILQNCQMDLGYGPWAFWMTKLWSESTYLTNSNMKQVHSYGVGGKKTENASLRGLSVV